jgi:hypothetical protein
MARWIEVKFEGQLPRGAFLVDIDATELAHELGRACGFLRVTNLIVEEVGSPEARRQALSACDSRGHGSRPSPDAH